jgi:hypothetical protein
MIAKFTLPTTFASLGYDGLGAIGFREDNRELFIREGSRIGLRSDR